MQTFKNGILFSRASTTLYMSVCMCQTLRMNIFTDMFSGCSDIFKKLNSQLHFCILSQTYFRGELKQQPPQRFLSFL